MTREQELLPCPFCGGPARQEILSRPFRTVYHGYCLDMNCPGASVIASPERWNRRAALSGVPQGYALVPLEPTEEMIEAGEKVFRTYCLGRHQMGAVPVYKAMLHTAPADKQPVHTSAVPNTRPTDLRGEGLYVASRTNRAERWRYLRGSGVPIVSSWIDEAGEGETADFSELWRRIEREIRSSVGLLFYADVKDAPWKGAFVEIGMALALGKPVGIVVVGELEGRTMRPVGSWIHDSRVTRYATVDEACKAMLGPASP